MNHVARVAAVLGLPVLLVAACAAPPDRERSMSPADAKPSAATPSPPADGEAAALQGRRWAWKETVTSGDKRTVAQAGERYTLEFRADGRVTVRADCNRGSGGYEADARRLTFSPIALTKMMCPTGSQDAEFLQALAGVGGWRLEGDELVLRLTAGGGTMRFRPLRP
jgi:heat shock protein HslJ